ncbi:MAG: P22 coat - protein 5 family protein [Proteobacteria bacterium]|jgi:hypothetical protein|nr:P22 coat - protein 5 family protein [Pseudomonadota bacterium]
MAENTISSIVPDIYEALDVVSRELTGLIPAVTMNASAERAGINQNIVVDVEPAGNVSNITPAMTVPDPTGQTSGSTVIQITKSRAAEFGFIGDDQKKLNTGPGYLSVRANKIAQAIRAVANEVESDLAGLQATFSRAYGTAGTTPFGTANDYTDASNVLKILKDNGSPQSDNQLVINTAAGANFIGKQSAVNSAGTESILRQGVLLDLAGMPLRESAQINDHTAGTGASATTNAAGYAVGATVLTLASAGTGTLLAGDVVTFAGDSNKYVITSGDADVSGGGTITLAAPGLRVAMSTATKAITVVASSARNMAFNRSALVLAARAPARPEEGDMAEDVIVITDPRSGLSMEFAMYKGYRKVRYEVGLAWGVKNIKPEHTALLLG